ncbi:MAG: peptide-methionine (R)-S-oxide reductase MsrB [Flavobacteriales bacterium]|jgi:peptide-methionine (R)-S-oxide reductase|nr:peptide-methionine (R)-S-oxide reductase MsrB [Flavobacteriales bacterium]
MKKLILFGLALALFSCKSPAQDNTDDKEDTAFKVQKTEAEWRAELSEEEFHILREAGTEPPFSSELNKKYEPGTYVCAACGTPLFEGEHKFDSGTGWPSFDRAIEGNVAYSTDNKIGYTRVEEHCATCGGHLGHVFNDGPPETTGKRHCVNGAALDFIPKNNE